MVPFSPGYQRRPERDTQDFTVTFIEIVAVKSVLFSLKQRDFVEESIFFMPTAIALVSLPSQQDFTPLQQKHQYFHLNNESSMCPARASSGAVKTLKEVHIYFFMPAFCSCVNRFKIINGGAGKNVFVASGNALSA